VGGIETRRHAATGTKGDIIRHLTLAAILGSSTMLAATPGLAQQAERQAAQTVNFSIAAQPLPAAIAAFIRATGWEVGYSSQIVAGKTSAAVTGSMPPSQALQTLLTGTGIRVRLTGATKAALVDTASAAAGDVEGGDNTLAPIVLNGDNNPIGPDATIVAQNSSAGSKTDTPIKDISASVSVVTQAELVQRGVTTLDEALSYTPGVSTDIYGSDNRYDHYMIRGFYSTGQSTYRDGLPLRIDNFTGSRLEPYGLQRIEVLKGANSTLFGLSQPGGIVNTVTKRPQDVKFGEVYTTLGDGHVETGTDFGGPIDADGLWSYRLTGKWQNADQGIGYSEDDRVYIAPALTFSPSVDTDITLLASYNKRDGSTSHGIPYLSGIDSETYLGEPGFDNMDTVERNIGYEFRHDFGNGLEFRQNARYTDLDTTYEGVFAPFAATIGSTAEITASRSSLAVYGHSRRYNIDNQLQYDASFGPFDSKTLIGASYEHDKFSEHRFDGTLPGIDPYNPVYSGSGSISDYRDLDDHNSQTAKSLYLQEELTLDDRWIATLGGRYDHVRTKAESIYNLYGVGSFPSSDTAVDEAFTKRAGLTYKATSEVAIYANYAESFQPISASRSFLTGDGKPQEGTQYEIGVKYQPEGMDALFTASVFDLTQTNVPQYSAGYAAQYQVGKINVRGLELEGKVALTNQLNLTAGYSYWDAEIEDDALTENIGTRPARVPKHMASLWADYTIPGNGTLGDMTLGLGARYVGQTYADNAIPERTVSNSISLPSRTVFDAAIKYKITDSMTLAVNATNLFDKEYISHVDNFSSTAYYGDRRTVMATLRYTW
jgi:iron complex outermembrane receptor protein